MTIRPGAEQIIIQKIASSKAEIAGLEAKAASQARFLDIEGALTNPAVARRMRNEVIFGILTLVVAVAIVFILFFVIS